MFRGEVGGEGPTYCLPEAPYSGRTSEVPRESREVLADWPGDMQLWDFLAQEPQKVMLTGGMPGGPRHPRTASPTTLLIVEALHFTLELTGSLI